MENRLLYVYYPIFNVLIYLFQERLDVEVVEEVDGEEAVAVAVEGLRTNSVETKVDRVLNRSSQSKHCHSSSLIYRSTVWTLNQIHTRFTHRSRKVKKHSTSGRKKNNDCLVYLRMLVVSTICDWSVVSKEQPVK